MIQKNSIDVSELQSGIYFIELSNSNFKITRKIVKIE